MAINARTLALIEEARKALNGLADGATRSLTAAWVRAWDVLATEFGAAVKELIKLGGTRWPSRTQIDRAARTSAALAVAARALGRLAGQARTEIAAAARQAVDGAHAAQEALAVSQLPPGAQVRFRRADHNALAQIINRTAQQIHAATRPLTEQMIEAMKRELIRGVALGSNPRAVARALLDRLQGAFAGGLSRALNIARSEILDSFRGAAALSQAANADILGGWMWTSALATTTCGTCWSLHGTVFPLDQPGPWDHPSGRCTRTPVVRSWADLGFDAPEPASIIPDARQMFDALPLDAQLRIMGPTRLALLKSGAIDFPDLARVRPNPGWRPSYAPVPVADLAAGAA